MIMAIHDAEAAHIFAVYGNADLTEGRGPMVFKKAFTNGDAAITYIKKHCEGVMGRKQEQRTTYSNHWATFDDFYIQRVPVYQTAADALANDVGEVRKRALAKLTPTERQALGL